MNDRPKTKNILLEMTTNSSVDPANGMVISKPGCSVNFFPLSIQKGCLIKPVSEHIRFQIYFYLPEIPADLIHTYCYQDEANWTTYSPELSFTNWIEQEIVLHSDGYIRAVINECEDGKTLSDYLIFSGNTNTAEMAPVWMTSEAERLVERAAKKRKPGDLELILLTDTHYAVGGIWEDTRKSIALFGGNCNPAAIIHLGDFTDGLLPGKMTEYIASSMITDLEMIANKVWCCVGNHDVNYFRGNPDRFTKSDCARLYLQRKNPWYFQDLHKYKLRLIFLDSFDPEERERYGFSWEELVWFEKTLNMTPKGWKILIFSHVPPAAEIHVWSKTIRNGETIIKMTERFQKRRGGAVMAWIHGHNHADMVYEGRTFPIIGIGCAKLEDFEEHKPKGSVTYKRIRNTSSQELWDFLLIHPKEGSMDFLRYGAGEDRHVEMRFPK